MDYQRIIKNIYREVLQGENFGKIPSYIPELGSVNENNFGIHLYNLRGESFGVGNYQEKFSIQSIAKVLSMSLAYARLGNKLWHRVGVEPSGTAFNSLVQLEADNGIPRNPLINAGAIVICDILLSILITRRRNLFNLLEC